MRQHAEGGLRNLGDYTQGQVSGAYDTLGAAANANVARQQALANLLNQNTQQIGQQTQQALTTAQTGELGGLTQALQSRNVDPGGSAAQKQLAENAAAQQSRQARMAQAQSSFANAQGGAFQGLAGSQALTGQMQGASAKANLANMIASRIADSNMEYNQKKSEARGKRADAKALFGATKLKNLLNLRGTEREYISAIGEQALKKAELAEKKRANRADESQAAQDEAGRNRRDKNDGGGSGSNKKKRQRRR